MDQDKYIALLQKELSGKISSSEKKALADWLRESPDNQLIADSVRKGWELSEGYSKELEVDLNAEFSKLEKRMDASGAKMVRMRPANRWLKIAAALLVLVVAAIALPRFFDQNQNWVTIHASQGESKEVVLADGTKIWLNEETTLEHPNKFVGNERKVKLTGEAFFEVEKNEKKPFIIEGRDGEITVLGTSFNVRDYYAEKKTVVTVRSGKVQFQPKGSDKKVILEQNDQVVFDKQSSELITSNVEKLNALGWHTKYLDFQGVPMRKALEEIGQAYNVKIYLTNGDMFNCPLITTYDNFKLETIIEILEAGFELEFVKGDLGDYYANGGVCK